MVIKMRFIEQERIFEEYEEEYEEEEEDEN